MMSAGQKSRSGLVQQEEGSLALSARSHVFVSAGGCLLLFVSAAAFVIVAVPFPTTTTTEVIFPSEYDDE